MTSNIATYVTLAILSVGLIGVFIAIPSISNTSTKFNNQPILNTPLGKLKGVRKNGAVTFYGIPYAQQPDRFKYAEYPPEKWDGVRDAFNRNSAPICPQDCYNEYGQWTCIPYLALWLSTQIFFF